MKRIKLTQGKVALVDDEDFDALSLRKWHAHKIGRNFYASSNERGHRLLMHRVVCGTPPGMDTDHINGNGLDNRRSNLRVVTRGQNLRNQTRKMLGRTSRYRGVSWHSGAGKWQAHIRVNGKSCYLGIFTSELAAARVYDTAGLARDPVHFTPNLKGARP